MSLLGKFLPSRPEDALGHRRTDACVACVCPGEILRGLYPARRGRGPAVPGPRTDPGLSPARHRDASRVDQGAPLSPAALSRLANHGLERLLIRRARER